MKFRTRCVLMVFLHYADDHPLFAYDFYSPKTKRIVDRQDVIFLTSVFPMRAARLRAGVNPEGEPLVAYRSPPSVRLHAPDDLSFKGWTTQEPIPSFDDEVSDFALDPPDPFLDDEFSQPVSEDPILPVHSPDHPNFGAVSSIAVPIRPMPGPVASSPEMVPRLIDESRDIISSDVGFSHEASVTFGDLGQSKPFSSLHDVNFSPSGDKIANFPVVGDAMGQSPSVSLPVTNAAFSVPNVVTNHVDHLDADGTTTAAGSRRANQRWYYETRDPDTQLQPTAPVLPKRQSRSPQRLNASRLGMMAQPVDSDEVSDTPGSSSATALGSSTGIADSLSHTLGDNRRESSSFPGRRDFSNHPEPVALLADDGFSIRRFNIRLVFPDGGAPTLLYSVHHGMPVSLLRQRLTKLFKVNSPVHLLVGSSFLDHRGSIPDRFFPDTRTPSPFLRRGSVVSVHFSRPTTEPVSTPAELVPVQPVADPFPFLSDFHWDDPLPTDAGMRKSRLSFLIAFTIIVAG